jgi:hypothetical protein
VRNAPAGRAAISSRALLKEYDRPFPGHGGFELQEGGSIRQWAKTSDVPDEPGVYLIFDKRGGALLYVGRAGTMAKDGKFKQQKLVGRLSARQKLMSRRVCF